MTQFRNFATLSIFRKRLKLRFSNLVERGQLLPTDHKLAPKWAWHGSHDSISKSWDPFNSSGMDEDTNLVYRLSVGHWCPRIRSWAPKWAWPGQLDPISKFWDPSIFCKWIKLHFSNLVHSLDNFYPWSVGRHRSRDQISQFNLGPRHYFDNG